MTEEARFYGIYRGVCVDNDDPEKRGRITARVPAVTGEAVTGWIWACRQRALGADVPLPGEGVFVMYEAGHPDFPVWLGVF